MSRETLYCLDSPRNSDSLSVSDNLCKVIVETGGGVFLEVSHREGLVLWRSPQSGLILYCPIDLLSAERVRKTTLDSDSLAAVTQVKL